MCVLALSAASPADVLFVDKDAPPGGDGLGWETALRFVQDALAIAREPGAGITEIRVAEGMHRPNESSEPGLLTTFELVDGVALRGGFAGLGAPDPDARVRPALGR